VLWRIYLFTDANSTHWDNIWQCLLQ